MSEALVAALRPDSTSIESHLFVRPLLFLGPCMSRFSRPRLEMLEDRTVPATFGIPWPDPRSLSVSFVPDGAQVGTSSSSLFATLDAVLPREVWQREVLRALQSWASVTGLDLVLVEDSGLPMGAPGAIQGDPRFGDIRIGGAPLTSGAVSTSVPFSPQAGTWSGDILFNTAASFGIGAGEAYDLFTVALHEAAHSLGIPGQQSDPSAVLYEEYTGPKAGLSPSEAAAAQALYGLPRPDRFEGRAISFHHAAWETYTQALATRREEAALDPGLPYAVDANLTAGDVDAYSYQASGPFTVSLSALGRSLLRGRLEVLDSRGRLVASESLARPGGDVTLRISARAGDTFTLRVSAAEPGAFGTGAYRLSAWPVLAAIGPSPCLPPLQVARTYSNDSLQTATPLSAARGAWALDAAIGWVGDVDWYRLEGFKGGALDAQAHALAEGMTLTLLDARGRALAVARGGVGGASLRAEGLPAGPYFLKVQGPVGRYRLTARQDAPRAVADLTVTGAFTSGSTAYLGGLLLPQSSVTRLELVVNGLPREGRGVLTLFDLDGEEALRLNVGPVGLAAATAFLPGDAYTVALTAGREDGSPIDGVTFELRAYVLSDPIGPQPVDPTAPPTRSVLPEWYLGPFKLLLGLTDPYGRPAVILPPPTPVVLPPAKVPVIPK
jgi:hypothetical protein